MSDDPYGTRALGTLPYPMAPAPAAPNPLGSMSKYFGQLQQLAMTSSLLHMPPFGGAPGTVPQAPPEPRPAIGPQPPMSLPGAGVGGGMAPTAPVPSASPANPLMGLGGPAAFTPGPPAPTMRSALAGPAAGAMFVSPSIAEGLDFGAAHAGLRSRRQQVLQQAAREIADHMGLNSDERAAIGAWSDGAENSVMSTVQGADPDKLRVAASLLGSLARQKQVLTFHEHEDGGSRLYRFSAKGALPDIHRGLLDDGVDFHTLEPTATGATVHVADLDGSGLDAIRKGAARHGARIQAHKGTAEFVPPSVEGDDDTAQRDNAVAAYRRTVEGTGDRGLTDLWERLHSTHGQTLAALTGQEREQAPLNALAGVGGAQAPRGALLGTTPFAAMTPRVPGRGNVPRSQWLTGEDAMVPTRVPWDVASRRGEKENIHTLPWDEQPVVDWKTATSDEAKDYRDAAAATVRGYPGMKKVRRESSQKTLERFVDHLHGNILALYDMIPPDEQGGWREHAQRWYDGANRIVHDWAEEHGYSPHQLAGMLANLSPKKDWFMNVDLGRRILETMRDHQDTAFSPEAQAKMRSLMAGQTKPHAIRESMRLYRALIDPVTGQGRRLRDLAHPDERGAWIMFHDLAHNSPNFRELSPDGDPGDWMRNKPKREGQLGTPTTLSWASLENVAKAMRALADPSLESISHSLGGAHKVRNFYNNIIAPNSTRGDVTVDTHAVAAGLLRPLGLESDEVEDAIGKSPSVSGLGMKALYPLFAEAYRRAGRDREILPRQMQSATWEGLRAIFSPEAKRDEKLEQLAKDTWNRYGKGEITAQAARQEIIDAATPNGKPRTPRWHRPPAGFGGA